MHQELLVAAELVAFLLDLPSSIMGHFSQQFISLLTIRYQACWHPTLHSAHRALTSFGGRLDPILVHILQLCQVDVKMALKALRGQELVIWIDPDEVAYRIGERGSVVTVYSSSSPPPPPPTSTSFFTRPRNSINSMTTTTSSNNGRTLMKYSSFRNTISPGKKFVVMGDSCHRKRAEMCSSAPVYITAP